MAELYLVGAGPGDPGLLTINALNCIKKADVIIYDKLVNPVILDYASPDCELIYVGKSPSHHTKTQEEINNILVEKAKTAKCVVRLKGGDPFVFGRGGEEASFLYDNGIKFNIVPGISSALAVPLYAGIPVTHRGVSSSFTVASGHASDGKEPDFSKTAKASDTLVLLMAMDKLETIIQELIESGRCSSTPAAIISNGTMNNQEVAIGLLDDISSKVKTKGITSPAILIVGEVVGLRNKLKWFENSTLNGKRILITRPKEQAKYLADLLKEKGAIAYEYPLIKIVYNQIRESTEKAINNIKDYDWLLFTSANGVRALLSILFDMNKDVRAVYGPQIAAIGSKTAQQIRAYGLRVDFTPSVFTSYETAEQFKAKCFKKKILIAAAEDIEDNLADILTSSGAIVETAAVYSTIKELVDYQEFISILQNDIDIVTFTSSSAVRSFVFQAGTDIPKHIKFACIGPITAKTAMELGLQPDIIAKEHTIEGLVSAISDYEEN